MKNEKLVLSEQFDVEWEYEQEQSCYSSKEIIDINLKNPMSGRRSDNSLLRFDKNEVENIVNDLNMPQRKTVRMPGRPHKKESKTHFDPIESDN